MAKLCPITGDRVTYMFCQECSDKLCRKTADEFEKTKGLSKGDIVHVNDVAPVYGCEQAGERLAIVVSNDKCNRHSPVVEIVLLTTQTKEKPMPTHVSIKRDNKRKSLAMCEAVHSVAVFRLTKMQERCSDKEIENINNALRISFAL